MSGTGFQLEHFPDGAGEENDLDGSPGDSITSRSRTLSHGTESGEIRLCHPSPSLTPERGIAKQHTKRGGPLVPATQR